MINKNGMPRIDTLMFRRVGRPVFYTTYGRPVVLLYPKMFDVDETNGEVAYFHTYGDGLAFTRYGENQQWNVTHDNPFSFTVFT